MMLIKRLALAALAALSFAAPAAGQAIDPVARAMAGQALNELSGALPQNCATLTTAIPCFQITGTWNASGVTFPGAIKVNMTNTASASGSLLMDLQASSSSMFNVDKSGNVRAALSVIVPAVQIVGASNGISYSYRSDGSKFFQIFGNTALLNVYNSVANAVVYTLSETGGPTFKDNALITKAGSGSTVSVGVTNSSTGANTNAALNLTTGTANSSAALQLLDNSGAPFFLGNVGSGVTGGWAWNGAAHQWRDASGSPWLTLNSSAGTFTKSIRSQISTAATGGDYLQLWPTDIGTGKPGFYIAKQATTTNQWNITLYDGTNANGTITYTASDHMFVGDIQLGGQTSAFPMLHRNNTNAEFRLADGSARAPVQVNYVQMLSGTVVGDTGTDGVAKIHNAAGTTAALVLGPGASASWPRLKANGAELDARLGDDSGWTNVGLGGLFINGLSFIGSPGTGIIRFDSFTPGSFARTNYGGDTSSFPAIRRDTTTLSAVLADNSAFTAFRALYFQFNAGSTITNPSDGVFNLQDSSGSTFTRVNLGPNTSNFPAFKRVGTQVQVRLADDSADASLSASKVTANGNSGTLAFSTPNIAEVTTTAATAATGTINYDIATQSVVYYTTNASANWTVNLRGSSGSTLDSMLGTGQAVTASFAVTQGGTAFYNTTVQVDGTVTGVTTKWQGGAPSAGHINSVDVYTYTIIKTGSATYTVLATQTAFS